MSDFLKHSAVSLWKELLLLSRDKAGLIVLFFMPAALVVIITLVQENVMELSGEKTSEILLYDQDKGLIGESIKESFRISKRVAIHEIDVGRYSREQALEMVNRGDYQALVILPKGLSTRLDSNAKALFEEDPVVVSDQLPVAFDPSVLPGYRTGIYAVLQVSLLQIEMERKIASLQDKANAFLGQQGIASEDISETGPLDFDGLKKELLELTTLQGDGDQEPPSAVQHNIPAWALFGLFFTCIPLAGSLLVERNSGIWIRLMSMPVSPGALLTGKICAYVGVCFCQIFLIVLIGFYVFPLLGLPSFLISGNPMTLVIISLCCSLAACGYGVFLGSICTSLEQASMFGSISIVIAASLGGTLVPTYAMPAIMQRVSVFSPLNWGLSSYQDVLLRGFDFSQISLNLFKLVAFFLVMLIFSWWHSRPR